MTTTFDDYYNDDDDDDESDDNVCVTCKDKQSFSCTTTLHDWSYLTTTYF